MTQAGRARALLEAQDLAHEHGQVESDGAWGVRVAIAPDGLRERERTYTVVTSGPYLLVVRGGEGCLGGIEAVADPASGALRIPLADGRALAAEVRPTAAALSDFVVQIAPELGTEKYRAKLRSTPRVTAHQR